MTIPESFHDSSRKPKKMNIAKKTPRKTKIALKYTARTKNHGHKKVALIRVAQRKRGGPITHKSQDRNLALIPC